MKFKVFLRKHSFMLAIGFALFLIVAVLFNYFSKFSGVVSSEQEVWGQFGDYFGGVLNPMLSFCALLGLLVTLRGQQEEGEKVEERHRQQTFDSRLFQLLSLSHEAVSAIKFVRPGLLNDREEYEGHRGVAYALNRLQEDYLYEVDRSSVSMYKDLSEKFSEWKKEYWTGVASYVESMLFILKYVIEKMVASESYSFALQAVFAQMSSDEKLLVFYVMLFERRQSILLSGGIISEFLDAASEDDLLPHRKSLLHMAIQDRIRPT